MALTERQAQQLAKQIEERRNVLLAELREDAERTREQPYSEHAGAAPDSGDESVATLIADLEQADVTRDLDEFRALEAARARMRDGGYGICVDCGTDIEFERLKVFPAAPRCRQCQERHEKTFGGNPKPTL
jgi:RNA polymerase-binding transcription factor DksA